MIEQTRIIAWILSLTLIAISSAAGAQPHTDNIYQQATPKWRPNHPSRLQHLTTQYQLDSKQILKTRRLLDALHRKTAINRRLMRSLKDQMKTLWSNPTPDKAALLEANRLFHACKQRNAELRIEFRIALWQLLTDKQRKQTR